QEALFAFVVSNMAHWLGSGVVHQWLWVMLIGSFGTILLRPYYLIIGLPTTLVAWLKDQNDLLWTPRFYSTAALLWCVTLVGVASTWLFRYAHDRNLFWLDRLQDRPAPVWMLGDSAEEYAPLGISSERIGVRSGIHLGDYTVIDRRGRFVLLRKKQ